jgi:hypothetical protein
MVSTVYSSTEGLVSQWSFNENDGAIAYDSISGNDGTLVGAPEWVTTEIPHLAGNISALSFDGLNDYIVIEDDETLDVSYVTLSAWIKIDPTISTDQTNIVRKGSTGTGADRVYGLTVKSSGAVRGFAILDSSLKLVDANKGTPLTKDEWHHIAMTYDGAKIDVYLDGELDDTSSEILGVIAENDKAVLIGGMPTGWCFKGLIDEVRIYNRALDANEIKSLADTTPPELSLPSDKTLEATGSNGAVSNFTATATDDVDGSLDVICYPASGSMFALGETTVVCSATDSNGNLAEGNFKVTVLDTKNPTIIPSINNGDLISLQTSPVFTFEAKDDNSSGIKSTSGTINGEAIPDDGYIIDQAGVYEFILSATDSGGNTSTESGIFVVYDSSAGFVTGGGWIDSPEGAYKLNTELLGKANFGFVSKYQKGAVVPTGNTQFQFKAGELNFSSTSYEWLVVAGTKAQFKGIGTINGIGEYKFMLYATDGGTKEQDQFRIKIWSEEDEIETVIYDNGSDAPILGGSIVIHSK